jgi:hypothetical protein
MGARSAAKKKVFQAAVRVVWATGPYLSGFSSLAVRKVFKGYVRGEMVHVPLGT